jgi:hypothetical protein
MNFMGEAALDQLHSFLKRMIVSGRQEQVEMIGHHNKVMQQIRSLVPVAQHTVNQDAG